MYQRVQNRSKSQRVRITEVNMTSAYVLAEDAYGGQYRITFDAQSPIVAVPAIGDLWIADRRGNDWYLNRRFETGSEQTAITSLSPGDRRIEADNDLHLNGKRVIVNGADMAETDAANVKGTYGAGSNNAVDELTLTPPVGYKTRRIPIADKVVHDLREFYSGNSQPDDVLGHIQDGLARSATDGGWLLIPDSVEPWVVSAGICPPPNSRMMGPGPVRFNTRLSDSGHSSLSYTLPSLPNSLGEAWIKLANGTNGPILYNDYTNAQGLRGPVESGTKYWQWFQAYGIVFDHNGHNQTGNLRAIDIRQAWGMSFAYCRLISPRGQGFVFDTCNECHGNQVSAVGEFEGQSNGTGDLTMGSNQILNANGTWAVGDWIVGTGIPSNTFVSVVSGTTLTLANQGNATAQNATITGTVALSKWVPMATSLLTLINTTDSEWQGIDMHAASYGTVRLDSAYGCRVSGLAGYAIGGCNVVLEDNLATGCYENKIDMRLDQATNHNCRIGTGCTNNNIDITAWMAGIWNKPADADGGWSTIFCDGNSNNLRGTGMRRAPSVSNMTSLVRYGANAQDNKGYVGGGSDIATGNPLYIWNGSDGVSKTRSNLSPTPNRLLLPGYSFAAADGTTPAVTTFNGTLHQVLGMNNGVDSSAVCYFTVPDGCRLMLVRPIFVNLDSTKSGNIRLQVGVSDVLTDSDLLGADETILGPISLAIGADSNTHSTSFTGTQVAVRANEVLCVRIKRLGSNGLDTLTSSVGLLGVRIEPLLVA